MFKSPCAEESPCIINRKKSAAEPHHSCHWGQRRIGREAALTYAEYGASVILTGRNEEKLKGVAQEIEAAGDSCSLVHARSAHLHARVMSGACSPHQHPLPAPDGVLHNAGLLGEVRPMDEQDPEIWQEVMQVNVNGTFFLTRHCFLYYSNRIRVHWCSPPPA